MSKGFPTLEFAKQLATKVAHDEDVQLSSYILAACSAIEQRGDNISDYVLVKSENPVEFTNDSSTRITGAWRVVHKDEIREAATYED